MSATFDAAKGYKRICFREDRDLLDTELNELQEIAITERRELLDRVYAPGTILDGLTATGAGTTLTVAEGLIYLDGHAVRVPGATLTCGATGVQTVWVDVFQRNITVADDPSLINPLTGEPTAEREKWIATLQTRDTSGDPLPEGASGRTVVAVMTYEPATGTITRLQPRPLTAGDATLLDQHAARLQTHDAALATLNTRTDGQDAAIAALTTQQANHHGKGGAVHPAATQNQAGFMSPADKVTLDALAQTAPVHHHDDRYFTEGEIDGLLAGYAPLSHVGAGGAAHPAATAAQAGFMTPADKVRTEATQRVASVLVAASDASPKVKASADVVCTGADDQTVILQAIEMLPSIPDACASIEFTDRTPDGGHIFIRAVRPGPEGNALTIAFAPGEAIAVSVDQLAIQVTYPAMATISQLATAINQQAGHLVFSHVVKYGPLPMLPSVPQALSGGTTARAGVVALSEGNFYIYQPIKVTNISRLTLSGNQSILRLVDSSYQWALEDATIVLLGCAYCTIEGLTLVGVGGANELDGILFTGSDMVIRDCRFVDSGQNAVDAQGDRNAIINCISHNAGSYFVICRQGYHYQVSGCRSEADAGGIALESCYQSVISGNVIADTQLMQGISIANSHGITVSGNAISYPTTAGVEIYSGRNVQVIGNQIIHAANDTNRWGVRCAGVGDFALLSGNLLVCPANQFEFFESGQYATRLAGSSLNLRHSTLG